MVNIFLIIRYVQWFIMGSSKEFNDMLKKRGMSKKAIEELWKWYDSSNRKGVASF